jgi:predicted transcriptional regulator
MEIHRKQGILRLLSELPCIGKTEESSEEIIANHRFRDRENMMRPNLTKDEIRIILKLNKSKIEYWAERKEFWKIYRHIIRQTKRFLSQKKQQ